MLDHPHIIKLYQVGLKYTGRHLNWAKLLFLKFWCIKVESRVCFIRKHMTVFAQLFSKFATALWQNMVRFTVLSALRARTRRDIKRVYYTRLKHMAKKVRQNVCVSVCYIWGWNWQSLTLCSFASNHFCCMLRIPDWKFIVCAIMSVVPFIIKHLVNRKFNVASFIGESSFDSSPLM